VRYDPMKGPKPQKWLSAEEDERLEAVLRYHRGLKIDVGSERMHAVIHTAVETQLAEGHSGASHALLRLLGEGLDRHEAVHAIATVFSKQLHGALQGRQFNREAYERDLEQLTVEAWRRFFEDEG
jgi:hypothetical protein